MRIHGPLLASVLLVAAFGCGGSSPTAENDGGGLGHDGAISIDGPKGGIDAPTSQLDVASTGLDAKDVASTGLDGGSKSDTPAGLDGSRVDGGQIVDSHGVDSGTAIDTRGIDGGAAGTCTLPACMAAVAATCYPAGACVQQSDLTTFATSSCYANGVKMVQQTGATGITVTFKNGASVCYTMAVPLTVGVDAQSGPLSIPVKNAAGASIATLSYDSVTKETSVICPGAAPVLLASGCTAALGLPGGSTACTQGTCTP